VGEWIKEQPKVSPPWTPRLKGLVDSAVRAAKASGNNYVGIEHLAQVLGLSYETLLAVYEARQVLLTKSVSPLEHAILIDKAALGIGLEKPSTEEAVS
jgi:hypothetical protein